MSAAPNPSPCAQAPLRGARASRRLALLVVGLAGTGLAGCTTPERAGRGEGRERAGVGDGPTVPDEAAPRPSPDGPDPTGSDATSEAVADVEPGPYARDPRFAALATSFPERVRAAIDRLDWSTGLTFRDRTPPRVVLSALDDESRASRAGTEVVGGRRRAWIRVNAEPILVGTQNADRVLLRALASAALEPTGRTRGAPRWFAAYVGRLACGDAADGVLALARAKTRGDTPPRVDAAEADATETTGLALALLLASRGDATAPRRLVSRVADGEDASRAIASVIGDAEGEWVGAARRALEDAVDDALVDVAPEARLVEARAALAETGPLGATEVLDRVPAAEAPAWFAAEADALRLRAALSAGDAPGARAALDRHPPEPATLGLLADPGSYVLDAARAESLTDGDALRAWERLVRFDLDFPAHPRRGEAVAEMLELVGRLPPDLEPVVLERVVRERGTGAISVRVAARRVESLLAQGKPGAAARFLDALGARADAGDLSAAREAVLAAQTEPSPASREAARLAAAAFVVRGGPVARRALADVGEPGADALVELLPRLVEPARGEAIRAIVRIGGPARAVAALLPAWGDARRRASDLDLLAGEVGFGDLRRTVEALDPAPADAPASVAAFEHATYGLDAATLAADDDVLVRLRSPEFSVRRAAFDALVDADAASPALLRRIARDPAILLRRRAVLAAGRLGTADVARAALADPAWQVRAAAATALADARDDASVPRIEAMLGGEEREVRVRASAAVALLRFADRGAARYRPIVALLRDADATLADGVALALAPDSGPALARAIASELAAETLDPGARLERGALFRLFVAYRRATGRDARYDPSLPEADVRRLVADLPEIRSARGVVPAPR